MVLTIVALTVFGAVIVFMAAYGYKISAKTAKNSTILN